MKKVLLALFAVASLSACSFHYECYGEGCKCGESKPAPAKTTPKAAPVANVVTPEAK